MSTRRKTQPKLEIAVGPGQNGTLPNAPTVAEFVQKYRSFTKRTAESIISLAKTLVEAKQSLSGDEFVKFCGEVNLNPDGSTFRKMTRIGEEAHRLEPHLDDMPCSWTTIWVLARLKPEELKRVVEDGKLKPSVKAKEIRDHIKGERTRAARKAFTINVAELSTRAAAELRSRLEDFLSSYKLTVSVSKSLSDDLGDAENA